MDYHGRRATIMGLGQFGGGAAAARWLARQGAAVTVTDLADEQRLAGALEELAGVPIGALHLGAHREEDFRRTDLVVVNPAVRPDNPFLAAARDAGARLTSELELFLESCPARIVGVTGSNGKSTTAAMTAAALRAAGRRSWLGGNIGLSLLDHLFHIHADDWVVLEISSFQLWHLSPAARFPQIAVVTNCTPNHLDWHGTMSHYAAAKQRILTAQAPGDTAVVNAHDPEVSTWSHLVRGRCLAPWPSDEIPPLAVPGEHNRRNAALAIAAAVAAGGSPVDAGRAVAAFRGLPQRLEHLGVVAGRGFYNDSTATTPESSVAALKSLQGRVWLLAGGRSKGFDLGPLAQVIIERACGAAFFGATRELLHAETLMRDANFLCAAPETLAEALAWCWKRSREGDAIVLSPACASTDQFRNFRHRGEVFSALVQSLALDKGARHAQDGGQWGAGGRASRAHDLEVDGCEASL